MTGKPVRSVLRCVDFVPLYVYAGKHGRDRFGRSMFVPIIEGTMSGSTCKIVPVDLGQYSSAREAVADGQNWAELI
jgi:hypothetical protein